MKTIDKVRKLLRKLTGGRIGKKVRICDNCGKRYVGEQASRQIGGHKPCRN